MRLAIVSTEDQWEIRQISRAARKRKHTVKIMHPEDMLAGTHDQENFDVVLIRPIKGSAILGRAIASAYLFNGFTVVDEKIAFRPGGNKFNGYVAFKRAGLNVPRTLMLNRAAVKEVKQWKTEYLVLKPVGGKRGEHIYRCLPRNIEKLAKKIDWKKDFIVQEFIPIEKELRVLVLGNRVLGAFKKESADWRHNVARGATAVKEKTSQEVKEIALKASHAARLEVAGVDLAYSQGKWFVLEVNRSPQFKGFQGALPDVNVAGEFVKYLEKKAKKKKPVYYTNF